MDIKEVKAQTSIRDVAGLVNINLGKAKNGRCTCPLKGCNSSTGFKYTDQYYKCFKCGRSGDVFNFLQDVGATASFKESLDLVNTQVMPEKSKSNTKYFNRCSCMQQAFEIYKQIAFDNWSIVVDYCKSRGWTNTEYLRGKVGLVLTDNLLQSNGFTIEKLTQLELYSTKEYYTHHLVFPMTDWYSNLVHLSGRSLDPTDDLRWKSTKGFPSITKWLYNSDIVKESSYVYLCEGMTDTMSLMQLGEPAIGMMGINSLLAMHHKHLEKLDYIVAFFDRDRYEIGTELEGKYKSWSQVTTSLVDLAILTAKPIYCVMAPNWSGVKDLNEYLVAIDYDLDEFNQYVRSNLQHIQTFAVDLYKDELWYHPTLWKLLAVADPNQDAERLLHYVDEKYFKISKYLKEMHNA